MIPQVVEPRRLRDAAWHWFDGLSNLQAAGFLSGVTLLVAVMALLLIAASGSRVAARQTTVQLQPAVTQRGERPGPPSSAPQSHQLPTVSEPALRVAVTLVPGVRLREQPSTSSPVLATLPVSSQLEILDGTTASGESLWARVRAADGAVGWVIVTAID